MPIKITDNLMSRPLEAGSGVRGLNEDPSRVLGNQVARPVGAPSVPRGMGVQNDAAGAEAGAMAAAMGSIAQSVTEVGAYYENLKIAEEDSRGSAALFKVRTKEGEVRKALEVEAETSNWSNDELAARYREAMQSAKDEVFSEAGLTNKKVAGHYDKQWQATEFDLSTRFTERVLVPRAVAQVVKSSAEIEDSIVRSVLADGSVEGAQAGIKEVSGHYAKPAVVASLGADKAAAAGERAVNRIVNATVGKKVDELTDFDKGPMSQLTGDPINDAAIKGDVMGQIRYTLESLPMPADQRAALLQKAEKLVTDSVTQRTVQLTRQSNEEERVQNNERKLVLQETRNSLVEKLTNGSLTRTGLQSTFNKITKSPLFAGDREALADAETLRVSLLDNVRAEERRVASDRAARQVGIGITTTKEADTSYNALTGGRTLLQLNGEEQARVFSWLRTSGAQKLPSDIKRSVDTLLLSHDHAQANAGLTLYNQLVKDNPLLIDDVHKDARNLAGRMNGGQDWKGARDGMLKQASLSPDEVKAAEQVGDKWLTNKLRSSSGRHPVLEAPSMKGAKNVPPSALAAWDREFNDALRGGEVPMVAAKVATARVGKSFGTSTLLSTDGSKVATMAAPEVVFNVKADVIRQDVIADGAPFGVTKDSKFKLQPIPQGRDTKTGGQTYFVQVEQADGSAHTAMDAQGRPYKYTFHPTENVAAKQEVVAMKTADAIANYNRLFYAAAIKGEVELPKIGAWQIPKGVKTEAEARKRVPSLNAQIWEQAVKMGED